MAWGHCKGRNESRAVHDRPFATASGSQGIPGVLGGMLGGRCCAGDSAQEHAGCGVAALPGITRGAGAPDIVPDAGLTLLCGVRRARQGCAVGAE